MATSREKKQTSLFIHFAIALVVFFIMVPFSVVEFLIPRVELSTYDQRMKLRGDVMDMSSDIVIVAIDDQSYADLGRYEWWPRTYHAKLIENLNKAGAKIIVFDVQFTERSVNPKDDQVFARAIEKAGNVILAGKVDVETKRVTVEQLIQPIDVLLEKCYSWGLTNFTQDIDHFVRYYPISRLVGDSLYNSLGIEALKAYDDDLSKDFELTHTDLISTLGPYKIQKDRGELIINYYGPPESFSYYSFSSIVDDKSFDLLEDRDTNIFDEVLLPGEVFKDKIVLIGASIAELHDEFPTPFYQYEGKSQLTPGVEIHANAIQTILDGNYIQRQSKVLRFLVLLLSSLLITLLIIRLTPLQGFFATLAAVVAFSVIAIYLFIQFNRWIDIVAPSMTMGVAYVFNTIYLFLVEQKEKRMLRGMFQHYVPQTVVSELIEHPEMLQLGGEVREMTVLFSDVEGFTSISEKLQPPEVVGLVNEYLTAMTDIIINFEGIIDKYEGDAIMAEFGAPIPHEDHALRACYVAMEMQDVLLRMRERWKREGRPPLKARVGINTGNMLVGNMGSREVFDYTVMGDNVNLASRLEGANKLYKTYVMISEATYQVVKDDVIARELDLIRVKGKEKPVRVYELIGLRSNGVSKEKEKLIAVYSKGLQAYHSKAWKVAHASFKEALRIAAGDGPSRLYLERCKEFERNAPPKDWDGVYTMQTK